jgi:hypothetical protein
MANGVRCKGGLVSESIKVGSPLLGPRNGYDLIVGTVADKNLRTFSRSGIANRDLHDKTSEQPNAIKNFRRSLRSD